MKLTSEQCKARMEHAENILRTVPAVDPTIAISDLLARCEDADDREEVWESIKAYADMRARLAIFAELERSALLATPAPLSDEPVAMKDVIKRAIDTASRILRAGGDYGDELSDIGLRNDLKATRDALRTLLATPSDKQDMLPQALWTRRGSGTSEWWSYKGYEARKDAADQWVLRRAGIELYRHAYLQVVMAHAERAVLAAAPTPSDKQEAVGEVYEHQDGTFRIGIQYYGDAPPVGTKLYAAPLAQSAEQDRIDAERYRYLRNCGVIVDFTRSGPWKFTDDVDAAIDKYLARRAAIEKGASK